MVMDTPKYTTVRVEANRISTDNATLTVRSFKVEATWCMSFIHCTVQFLLCSVKVCCMRAFTGGHTRIWYIIHTAKASLFSRVMTERKSAGSEKKEPQASSSFLLGGTLATQVYSESEVSALCSQPRSSQFILLTALQLIRNAYTAKFKQLLS